MFSNMDVLKVYSAMARHAAENQKVSATNIAHANDPGYKASEVESFEAFLGRAMTQGTMQTDFKVELANTPTSPNGNSVNLEHELYKSAEAMGQHQMALTVYTKSLDLLRTAIGKGR
ncbi:flagellar biosynthesis protein FlgB [Henriciella litoralis]|uniref:flagellar biosynthesis protein FlgB n=1 Tax=Henriciella litoralis TaxID=568102 RepID=UPI001F47E3CB|nr:flagellar biosynthesis protein FlgB [Henriciella litoralis]